MASGRCPAWPPAARTLRHRWPTPRPTALPGPTNSKWPPSTAAARCNKPPSGRVRHRWALARLEERTEIRHPPSPALVDRDSTRKLPSHSWCSAKPGRRPPRPWSRPGVRWGRPHPSPPASGVATVSPKGCQARPCWRHQGWPTGCLPPGPPWSDATARRLRSWGLRGWRFVGFFQRSDRTWFQGLSNSGMAGRPGADQCICAGANARAERCKTGRVSHLFRNLSKGGLADGATKAAVRLHHGHLKRRTGDAAKQLADGFVRHRCCTVGR